MKHSELIAIFKTIPIVSQQHQSSKSAHAEVAQAVTALKTTFARWVLREHKVDASPVASFLEAEKDFLTARNTPRVESALREIFDEVRAELRHRCEVVAERDESQWVPAASTGPAVPVKVTYKPGQGYLREGG